jgi:hypothetical protein
MNLKHKGLEIFIRFEESFQILKDLLARDVIYVTDITWVTLLTLIAKPVST